MPLLASLLSGLFAALVEFFARYFTKKVALATPLSRHSVRSLWRCGPL